MIRFAAKRFAGFVVTSLVAAILAYLLLRLAPADVAAKGDLPGWLGGMFIGNFGVSNSGVPVGGMIGGALAVSLPLIVLAAILTAVIGTGLGWLAARRPDSIVDKGLQGLAELGVATPNFWLGILLAILFSAILRWLPAAGFIAWNVNPLAALAALVLPAVALAIPQGLGLARLVRSALVDARRSAYFRASEARGVSTGDVLLRHAIPNAAQVVASALGAQFGALIAGAMIVENVFYLPGLGRLIFDAVNARDLTVVRSGVLVLILLLTVTAFLAQLCRGWADPRLRAERPA